MKNKNGFTLVELLAVIVILAIIMIIAIPSVLGTMTSAKQKSFLEYGNKVYLAGLNQYTMDKNIGSLSTSTSETSYIYDIRTDLGISLTGNYFGFFIVYRCTNKIACPKSQGITIVLFDDEYYGYFQGYDNSFNPTIDDIYDVSVVEEYAPLEQIKEATKKDYVTYFMTNRKCNTLEYNIYDGITNELLGVNEAHPNAWTDKTCKEEWEEYLEEQKDEN